MEVLGKKSVLTCAFVLLAGLASSALAADVVVVANSGVGVDNLSKKEVKSVFLGKKKSLGGSSVKLATLKGDAKEVHGQFLKAYVSKSPSQFKNYYKKLVFTGKGKAPKSFASEAALLSYVAKTNGAVGYVSSGAASGSVKTISVSD